MNNLVLHPNKEFRFKIDTGIFKDIYGDELSIETFYRF